MTYRCYGEFQTNTRIYSSPFTFWAETPINTGVASGEEWSLTLHHSSPCKFYTPKTEFSVVKLQAFDSLISSLVFVKLRYGFLSC